ncbi:acyl-CoA thioesterase [Rhodococcoides fascians]|uniref:acyl-CoA thioesterase n=1 Tax=Rhodococcoides fascians TaxID=1828 RepID=UPI00050BF983|nr:thioesterase family protein [Rhodococcus fascians]
MSETARSNSSSYPYQQAITTRWMDNDMYGHVNNVQYYSFFDTVVTTWLIKEGGLDPEHGPSIGLCVSSECNYHAPLSFPDVIDVGLRVGRIGRSSVRYELELRVAGSHTVAATGHFVHVYVDRNSRRPTALSDEFRAALSTLVPAKTYEVANGADV